jgi:hypothetical protein
VLLVFAVGCSAGAAPWPSPASSEAGSGPGALPSPSDGRGGAPSSPSANAGQGAGGAAGASEAEGGAASAGEPPPGAAVDPPLEADASTPPALCQQQLGTLAEPPTVIVVADRSGSMFDPLDETGSTAWTALRALVLELVLAVQNQARFGFTASAGNAEVCPELTSLPPELGNHAAIQALYGSLERSLRIDGGPALALDDVEAVLSAAAGERHVWLVTDGSVDYCDDGNPLCPVDSSIGRLQRLAAASPSIRTRVFGVAPPTAALPAAALQAFALAGAAQPVALPATGPTPTDPNAMYDQCSSAPSWAADFARTGKPDARGQSIGDYADGNGTAVVHSPANDIAALTAELRAELVAERPCSFELARDGVSASALAGLDDNAVLELDGAAVAHDEQDGWHRVGASTLRLEGASCRTVRAAAEPPALQIRWLCSP